MKLTTNQLKQIIKEELQYLYETEEDPMNRERLQQLFRVGLDDFGMMRVLMEDAFGLEEGKDFSLFEGDRNIIVTIYSDDEQFLDLIHNSLGPESERGPVTYEVEDINNFDVLDGVCKTSWRYALEVFNKK